jgi:hypothetical protein
MKNRHRPGILDFCVACVERGINQSSQLTPSELDVVNFFIDRGAKFTVYEKVDDPALNLCLVHHTIKRLPPQKSLLTRLSTCLRLFEQGSFYSGKLILDSFSLAQIYSFYRGKKPLLTEMGRKVLYQYRLKEVERKGLCLWLLANERCPVSVGRRIGEYLFEY